LYPLTITYTCLLSSHNLLFFPFYPLKHPLLLLTPPPHTHHRKRVGDHKIQLSAPRRQCLGVYITGSCPDSRNQALLRALDRLNT
jgi:hypothetical protein